MFVRSIQIPLPRRVSAYFLLFGLAAIISIGAGIFYVSSAVTRARSASGVLNLLGKASHRLAIEYLETKHAGLQGEVQAITRENDLAYAALVGTDGEYLAHSLPEMVTRKATEPAGEVSQWGDVQRVRYVNEQGIVIVEYRAPLAAGDQDIGSLRMAVAQPTVLSTITAATSYLPIAIFAPLLCLGLGAVMLSRIVQPVAAVEQQLRKVAVAPTLVDCPLEEVTVRGAASMGWNRMISERAESAHASRLEERLAASLKKSADHKLADLLNTLTDGIAMTDGNGAITYHNVPTIALLDRRNRPRPAGDDNESANKQVASKQHFAESTSEKVTQSTQSSEQEPSHQPLIDMELVTLLGRNWEISPESPLLHQDARHRTVVVELDRKNKGQHRVLRVTRTPLRDADNHEGEGHVWTLRDVTQQRLADEMRTQFVDTATHELRTPLANIKAYAETLALQDIPDVEQQKEFLNTINSEATRLARFVDDLLSVSSMEVGSLSINKKPTDLQRLMQEVVGKVKGQLEEKDLAFETQFPEKWPEPPLDKDKISATVVNLLGNAVKYTPAGGRVGLKVKVSDGHLQISIEDTGIGIKAEEIPKLFDKFFRSEDPRVHEVTGTGLGLSLANEVVRLHGGKITVDSELEKGSTFEITLPLE